MKQEKYSNQALIKEVLDLTKKYCTKKSVKCIYFLPFLDKNKDKVFSFNVVFDRYGKDTENEFAKLQKKYNSRKEQFGGRFLINCDKSTRYGLALNPSEVRRVKDLLSSQILYDPTGKYEMVAHQFDKYETLKPYINIFSVDLVEDEEYIKK